MKRILGVCLVAVAGAMAWGEDENKIEQQRRQASCECVPTDATPSEDDGEPCRGCKTGKTRAKGDVLCVRCARSTDVCENCGKVTLPVGKQMVLTGTLSLVDKQPEKDMTYYVLTKADGSTQGVYVQRHRELGCGLEGRLLIRAIDTQGGAVVIIREAFSLGATENDGTFEGKGSAPVRWVVGGIRSEPVEPVDGKYTLVVPAVLNVPVTIHAEGGARVVAFDGKEWTEK